MEQKDISDVSVFTSDPNLTFQKIYVSMAHIYVNSYFIMKFQSEYRDSPKLIHIIKKFRTF